MTEPTTTHTAIPNSELAVDAPARSINALQLRDNNTFVREGQGQFVYFTADGTYTVPASLSRIRVTVVGGGGSGRAGGGVSASPGGGGGAAIETIEFGALGATETVTVGAGAPNATDTSAAGGSSSFGAFCSATGGAGGALAGLSVAGGVGSGGDLNLNGGRSAPSATGSPVPGGNSPVFGTSVGTGGLSNPGNSNTNGGADGIVIIEEFY